MSHIMDTMSNFSVKKLIQRSEKIQMQHFVTTVSIFLYRRIFKKKKV